MSRARCTVDDCDRAADALGLCVKHYSAHRRTLTCGVEGCPLPHKARGWCKKHHQRVQTHGDPLTVQKPTRAQERQPPVCAIEGCDRPTHAKNLCGMHHMRQVRAATYVATQRYDAQTDVCTVDGCGKRPAARNLCRTHYMRVRRGESTVRQITPDLEQTVRALYDETGSLLAVSKVVHLGMPRLKRILGITAPLPRGGDLHGRNRAPTPTRAPVPRPVPTPRTAEPAPPPFTAPSRWPVNPADHDPAVLAAIVHATLARCSGDARAARKWLGIDQLQFDRARAHRKAAA